MQTIYNYAKAFDKIAFIFKATTVTLDGCFLFKLSLAKKTVIVQLDPYSTKVSFLSPLENPTPYNSYDWHEPAVRNKFKQLFAASLVEEFLNGSET